MSFYPCRGGEGNGIDPDKIRHPISAGNNYDASPLQRLNCLTTDNTTKVVTFIAPEDCAFVVTHTGVTKEMLSIARMVKSAGGKVIVITSYPNAKISEYADVTFVSTSEETGYRPESLSSRYPQLAIIDSLYTTLMFRNPNASESLSRIRTIISTTKEDH